MINSAYQIGGSLAQDAPTYVVRKADFDLYSQLQQGHFCYVLNSRQMGKSSLLVKTRYRLQQEGFQCATLDMTRIGSEMVTEQQWYKGIVTELWRGFNLLGKFNLKNWWKEQSEVSVIQRISNFIEDILLVEFPGQKLIIFVDEIDSILSLNFKVDDFFALIRFCYNQRAINPEYNRISFALFGVATPSALISDRTRTPFNIGKAIELSGFTLNEVQPLIEGLEPKITNAKAIMQEIIAWTGGQPFLTQKICQLVINFTEKTINQILIIPPGTEGFWVESLVRSQIIYKWESQDEPEHLKTIRNRIQNNPDHIGRILGIYQDILRNLEVLTDDSNEQSELILSGLVIKYTGFLRVKNRIYQEVFDLDWVNQQLRNLRPYSQGFDAWIESQQQDSSRLLRGQALKEAQNWSSGRSISDLDYQFLAKSEELDRQEVQKSLEAARMLEVEARLTEEKKTAKLQRFLLISVSSALVITIILGLISGFQYHQARVNEHQAKINEVKAINQSSESLFALNQRFEALIQSMIAYRKLQTLSDVDTKIHQNVQLTLQKAVYGIQEYNQLLGHTSMVSTVQFSPKGDLIASGSQDKTVKLWKPDGSLWKTLIGHEGGIIGLAFSPRHPLLASASGDKTIKLWKTDGSYLRTLNGHKEPVLAVSFSPNQDILISASFDHTIKLWTIDGKLLKTIPAHGAEIRTVVFSPDGQRFASGSADNTVKIWKSDGTLLKTLTGHQGEVMAVAWSPDGQTLASASRDKTIKLWSREGLLVNTLGPFDNAVWDVVFSPNQKFLAAGMRNKEVQLWRKDAKTSVYTPYKTLFGHNGEVSDIVFSPDSQIIASASWDKSVKLWKTKDYLVTRLIDHQDSVWGIAFSPDGQTIASSSLDQTIKLWTKKGQLLQTLTGQNSWVNQVEFSSNGQWLASASSNETIKLWKKAKNGTFITNPNQTLLGHKAGVWGIKFTPDNQSLISASWDESVKIWGIDGTLRQTLKNHNGQVWGIAIAPTGDWIASSSDDKTIKLWKFNGQLLQTLTGHQDGIWGLALSPDGQILASASRDETVKLWRWNPRTKSFIYENTLKGHTATVMAVAFSPDQKLLASASQDNTIKLWKLDGTLIKTLNGHNDQVYNVKFSPDGQTLASVSEDKTVILWNLDQVLNLNEFAYACDWIKDYLKTNSQLSPEDRILCQ
ncbi:AAA-like domain-containing protein [Planktothrix agardhii 1029]|uniref:WD40 domain-containing protein n=1 Tax=Planktothrix agardhii TaxID=1160 RepID=UPI001D0A25CC|nr:AAA-like domain-containing protein [Planktothrix agardhii]MCB8764560.1 AAA-like domain-containing protein [Planktothrix agardhii 1809]MCB8766242.1 AAA-like domain-containing protein [Planktothrix agardhii 1809]MCB8778217.1 AAA-like domain-containing protein [Planktothrix agardhii 1031]MCB8782618.1 AAA-like domain-containing protein [Planktothrix agardhii 1808]MCF3566352.1 AAA-like domain-containing protein [Planktothrix agardhii 1807]